VEIVRVLVDPGQAEMLSVRARISFRTVLVDYFETVKEPEVVVGDTRGTDPRLTRVFSVAFAALLSNDCMLRDGGRTKLRHLHLRILRID
jgi:hypothetical protein